MTTEKQDEANKKNFLDSTGQITSECKVITAENVVKHGNLLKTWLSWPEKIKLLELIEYKYYNVL